jgi:deoxycytidine triphosphate deaminase
MIAFVVLSDGEIRRLIEAGRIGIEPFDATLMQPSSLDVRVDRYFRVFRNSRYPYIDVKQAQEELTELEEVAGEDPFILHPGEFVLGSTLERVTLPDDLVARLEGKALALDTEIPTSDGWRLMGDLRPGDLVFTESGEPTVVLAATEPMIGRPCFEVVFSDGTTVVCDAAHEWETIDKNGRRNGRRSRIVTTAEIAKSLTVRGERNHQVPLAEPVHYSSRELPVDPYVLGVWLGDGTTTAAEITCAEPAILEEVGAAGYAVAARRTRRLTYRIGGAGHTRDPRIGRLTANASLNRDCGPRFRLRFTPDRPVFRLERKQARQKLAGRFHGFRSIAEVRAVPSVPVRCIQVSSPRGLFLITRSYVATHNSSLGRLGLLIHSTAGFIDPGWDGHVTLELSNVANLPITIYPGMKIGQLSFVRLTEPAERPYGSEGIGSKYQGQRGPTPSRYWRNFTAD